ncbi:sialidase family protein [Sorangium atrum]|uniref:Sialidase family protein n=1 Tax=Sorangium atrum TaxID=2995308 RepID=A0ABT5CBR9_9BACT|nr:sialidase family protein [Sorangium aterium]MDC0683825.1 sialidase family protein [Sorangium aterium]
MIWLIRAAGCVLLAMACGCGGGGNGTGGAGAGSATGGGASGAGGSDGAGGSGGPGGGAAEELPLQWTKIDPVRTVGNVFGNQLYGFNRLFVTSKDTVLGTAVGQDSEGLFRSTDRGATWTGVTNNGVGPGGGTDLLGELMPIDLTVRAEAGGRLFALSWYRGRTNDTSGGLYVSEDDGVTWSALIDEGGPAIGELLVVNAERLLVTTVEGVKQSTDGGRTWEFLGPAIGQFQGITLDRNGAVHVASSAVVARKNPEERWFEYLVGEDLTRPARGLVFLESMADGTLLGSDTSQHMVRSRDYGDSWTIVPGMEPIGEPHQLVQLRSGSHVGVTASGLWYSHDYGSSWAKLRAPEPGPWSTAAQLSDGSLLVSWYHSDFGSTKGRLYISAPFAGEAPASSAPAVVRPDTCKDGALSEGEERTDCGGVCGMCEDWTLHGSAAHRGIFVSSTGRWYSQGVLGRLDGSDDEGNTWRALADSFAVPQVEQAGRLYALVPGYLQVSDDDGETWSLIAGEGMPANPRQLAVMPDGHIFGFFDDGIFGSADGQSWDWLLRNVSWARLLVGPDQRLLAVHDHGVGRMNAAQDELEPVELQGIGRPLQNVVIAGDTIYAVSEAELFVTNETFATFTSKGMLPRGAAEIFAGPHGELITYTPSTGPDLAFHISRDGGATWQPRNAGLPGLVDAVVAQRPDGGLMVACLSGIYRSAPISAW